MDNETNNEPTNETPSESEVIPPSAPREGWHSTVDGFVRFTNGYPMETESDQGIAERLNTARAEVVRLQTEQIQGSDHRLAEFWAKAQELADRANHCEVFDQIAEALGGPRREREYTITVDLMVSVPVSVTVSGSFRSEEDADDYARDYVRNMSGSEFEDQYTDWYSADADTYSMSVVVEED